MDAMWQPKIAIFHKVVRYETSSSSPNYPNSNGMVERAIGAMKTVLLKFKDAHYDPNLALIIYNTPKCNLQSPAQVLIKQVLRPLILAKVSFLNLDFVS